MAQSSELSPADGARTELGNLRRFHTELLEQQATKLEEPSLASRREIGRSGLKIAAKPTVLHNLQGWDQDPPFHKQYWPQG